MTDDLLYRPDELPGALVPYQCGLPCWHRLRAEVALQNDSAGAPAEMLTGKSPVSG